MEKKNESAQMLMDCGLFLLLGFVGPLESISQTPLAFSVFFFIQRKKLPVHLPSAVKDGLVLCKHQGKVLLC